MSHVPFDAERGEVLIACQQHYMGVFPPMSWFRLFAVENEDKRSLGEYIVDHVVRAHGGTVEVLSAAGEGTTFGVRLPREPPAAIPPDPVGETGE